MKNRFILSRFFYFASVLSLLLCFGCGDTEDEQEATNPTNNTLLDEPDEQSLQPAEQLLQLTAEDREKLEEAKQWLQLTVEDWEKLEDEDWEKLKGEDWVRLTNAEVRKLMRRPIGRWGFQEQPWEEAQKDTHAQLFQEFGDIPQVRYTVEFDRHYWKEASFTITLTPEIAKQFVGYWAANYFLFPTEDHKRLLEDEMKELKTTIAAEERRFSEEELRSLEQLRIEDPQAWIKGMRAFLIQKHGDIPEVDTIANFLRKVELNLPRTDEECRTYLKAYNTLYADYFGSHYEYYAMLEASDQLRPIVAEVPLRILEKFREARAEGISFYDIDGDDD
ncbi:hypothetical protein F4Z99_16150 [Candidatus Poribacteria bacterium]|nr:hypothetical protein [Candidatus Poribacteria bacterium]MYB00881.1 hypothetical protein [Candidatus Poribacteria bacterium]